MLQFRDQHNLATRTAWRSHLLGPHVGTHARAHCPIFVNLFNNIVARVRCHLRFVRAPCCKFLSVTFAFRLHCDEHEMSCQPHDRFENIFFSFLALLKYLFFLWRWWTLKAKGNDSAYFYWSSCFAKNSARVRAVLRLLTKHCRSGNGSLLFIIQLNCSSVGLCLQVKSWAEALS